MEIWKKIDGYESYWVSNFGNIKSIFKKGNLNIHDNGNGYKTVCLYKDKKQKRMLIHRLVALHFIKNISQKPDVNHKDGNKSNNHINNLEWVTKSENIQHGFRIGLFDNSREKSRERMFAYLELKRNNKQSQLKLF